MILLPPDFLALIIHIIYTVFCHTFLVNRSAKRSATAPKRKKAFRQNAGRLEFTGAGEKIRTLDPRLGKLVS